MSVNRNLHSLHFYIIFDKSYWQLPSFWYNWHIPQFMSRAGLIRHDLTREEEFMILLGSMILLCGLGIKLAEYLNENM